MIVLWTSQAKLRWLIPYHITVYAHVYVCESSVNVGNLQFVIKGYSQLKTFLRYVYKLDNVVISHCMALSNLVPCFSSATLHLKSWE